MTGTPYWDKSKILLFTMIIGFILVQGALLGCSETASQSSTVPDKVAVKADTSAEPITVAQKLSTADSMKSPPKPDISTEVTGPSPTIEFTETSFDFGDTEQDKSITHTFRFKNTGNADLEIKDVKGG
ncbi:DUF1573 domain-containing protein [bacterium]|nr:DUF1573 domain-containing protein [candidate division CSSED10-310 bacterium]